ncbi:hypothetical protein IKG20_02865 [Candidatus Saccharibacteria bacterium]|nr:hypothetical protein [Candidatus Saccharibacteria bacterium]
MKRIILVTLVTVLCLGLVSTAFAGCSETYTVFMPKYTETTTTTYGCYKATTVSCAPVACQPTVCQPVTCQPQPCTPCTPCQPVACSPCKTTDCSVKLACNNIRAHANDVLDLLDRELEGSGWKRLKNAKRILNKTNRIIYSVTFEKEDDGEQISCYLIVRTPYATISKTSSCDPCNPCGTKVNKCVPYYTMFTWNYNTGCRAREYDDDWLITGWDQYADAAVIEFVRKLMNDEVCRW